MIHTDRGIGSPRSHIALHRHKGRLSCGGGYRLAQRLPVRRYQQNGRSRSRHLMFQQLYLFNGTVVLRRGQEAQLHVQILGRLLHALSHGGNIAVSIPQNNGHFQQGWLVMLIAGSEGQQPEQHTQSNQGKHQLQ